MFFNIISYFFYFPSTDDQDSQRYSPCVLTDETYEITHPLQMNGIHLKGLNQNINERTVIT